MADYERPEVGVRFEERALAEPQTREMPALMDRLGELLDHCEKGVVALVDARGRLEDRIGPVLGRTLDAGPTLASWPTSREPVTALGDALAAHCRRLEQLVDSLSAEEQKVRSIADRVEV